MSGRQNYMGEYCAENKYDLFVEKKKPQPLISHVFFYELKDANQ
jgi:hypothetical protein